MTIKESKNIFSNVIGSVKGFYKRRLVACAIFGSFARDTATCESDIDILIVADNLPQGRIKRIIEFETVEENLMRKHKDILFSPIIKTPQEVRMGSPLFWDMTEHIIILYDCNDFFKDFLQSVAERLKKNRARKITKGSAWYWILKEDYSPEEIFEL